MSAKGIHSDSDWVTETVAALPPLATVQEVCAVLRTSRRNLYRLLSSGKLNAVRPSEAGSSPHLIPRAEVARYLQSLVRAA